MYASLAERYSLPTSSNSSTLAVQVDRIAGFPQLSAAVQRVYEEGNPQSNLHVLPRENAKGDCLEGSRLAGLPDLRLVALPNPGERPSQATAPCHI